MSAIPEGFKIYDGTRDWRFLPGAKFMAKTRDEWVETRVSCPGAIAEPALDIIVPIKPEPELHLPADPRSTALDEQVGGAHYKDFAIQPVEFIQANGLNFLEGGIVKRICRHRRKNKAEDLRKLIHEAKLLLKLEYGEDA